MRGKDERETSGEDIAQHGCGSFESAQLEIGFPCHDILAGFFIKSNDKISDLPRCEMGIVSDRDEQAVSRHISRNGKRPFPRVSIPLEVGTFCEAIVEYAIQPLDVFADVVRRSSGAHDIDVRLVNCCVISHPVPLDQPCGHRPGRHAVLPSNSERASAAMADVKSITPRRGPDIACNGGEHESRGVTRAQAGRGKRLLACDAVHPQRLCRVGGHRDHGVDQAWAVRCPGRDPAGAAIQDGRRGAGAIALPRPRHRRAGARLARLERYLGGSPVPLRRQGGAASANGSTGARCRAPSRRWRAGPACRWSWSTASPGHSTRVSAAQDMIAAGIELPAILEAGRWKPPAMVDRYGEQLLSSKSAAKDRKRSRRAQSGARRRSRHSGG